MQDQPHRSRMDTYRQARQTYVRAADAFEAVRVAEISRDVGRYVASKGLRLESCFVDDMALTLRGFERATIKAGDKHVSEKLAVYFEKFVDAYLRSLVNYKVEDCLIPDPEVPPPEIKGMELSPTCANLFNREFKSLWESKMLHTEEAGRIFTPVIDSLSDFARYDPLGDAKPHFQYQCAMDLPPSARSAVRFVSETLRYTNCGLVRTETLDDITHMTDIPLDPYLPSIIRAVIKSPDRQLNPREFSRYVNGHEDRIVLDRAICAALARQPLAIVRRSLHDRLDLLEKVVQRAVNRGDLLAAEAFFESGIAYHSADYLLGLWRRTEARKRGRQKE